MKQISIQINATPKGVETIVSIDGNEKARRAQVPISGGSRDTKNGDWYDDLKGYPALAELLEDDMAFFPSGVLRLVRD